MRISPRKTALFLAAGALVILAGTAVRAQEAASVSSAAAAAFKDAGLPLLRRPVESFDFSADLAGRAEKRKLSDFRGKVVFLNFWASWCGPCRNEMPSMEALYRRLKGRGFEMLGVNCGEKALETAAFMRNNGLSFETALDISGEISRKYGISAIPATFIIGRDGKIISRITGSLNWNDPKIIAAFEALLKE